MDAVCKFIKITQDKVFAESVFDSIKNGLDYLLVNEKEGLIFPGGLFSFDAIDWPSGFGHCPQSFTSAAVYHMMTNLRELAIWLGKKDYADELLTRAEKLKKTINEKLWMEDKGYYRVGLAIDDKVGNDDRDAQLFSQEMISWGTLVAVLWGVAEGDRAKKALQSVKERLLTPYGMKFFDPCWSPSYTDVKKVGTYEIGRIQNGAHWHTWWVNDTYITCQIMLGNTEEALRALHDIRLDTTNDRFKMTEKGKEMSFVRAGEWTDTDITFPVTSIPYTLTAGFFNQMLIEAVLGIKVDYDTLRVEPHIPADWDNVKISDLTIGDSIFDIEIRRDGTAPRTLLDSKETNIISITSGRHRVEVILG
jgi:cellobiose phosphorylase